MPLTLEQRAAAEKSTRDEIARLAELSPLELEQERRKAAERLGIRATVLDAEIKKHKTQDAGELVADVAPWPEPVNAGALLAQIKETLIRYVALPTGAADALTLWIAGTYAFNAFSIYPKLTITSPEKRCGKSTLLNGIIEPLAYRSLTASNITSAAVFRVIDACQPTLLIDEADTFLNSDDALRGVINSSHTKSGAHVIRVVGDTHELKRFSTWAPMAIAMIKKPAGTILDRSIVIEMRRRLPGETVSKVPLHFSDQHLSLRRKLKRWADDSINRLEGLNPVMPESENDRALDNWMPLFLIAEMTGGEWPAIVLASFHTLNVEADDDSIGSELLADVKSIFQEKQIDRIHSTDLVNALITLEERPWSTWRRGKSITANNLSRLLKPFGVKSADLRIGHLVKRGFKLETFEDAFNRYLCPDTPSQSATTLQPKPSNGFSPIQSTTPGNDVALEKPLKPKPSNVCSAVALCEGGCGQSGTFAGKNTPKDEAEALDERAAILEYDGGLTHEEVERSARSYSYQAPFVKTNDH